VREPEIAVTDLIDGRELAVPDKELELLTAHWQRMRELRGALDERLLGDAEPAITWTARSPDAD